jgi:hypothetical protein
VFGQVIGMAQVPDGDDRSSVCLLPHACCLCLMPITGVGGRAARTPAAWRAESQLQLTYQTCPTSPP